MPAPKSILTEKPKPYAPVTNAIAIYEKTLHICLKMPKRYTYLILQFIIGFTFFITIECIFHALSGKLAYSWITSGVMGGLSLILIDKINDTWFGWDTQLIYQSLIGGTLVTIIEFIVGTLDRVVLHLNMWDYSFVPLNYKGIICVPFSIAWCLLSILAIFIGDAVRYYIFGEEPRPYYWIGNKKLEFKERP